MSAIYCGGATVHIGAIDADGRIVSDPKPFPPISNMILIDEVEGESQPVAYGMIAPIEVSFTTTLTRKQAREFRAMFDPNYRVASTPHEYRDRAFARLREKDLMGDDGIAND